MVQHPSQTEPRNDSLEFQIVFRCVSESINTPRSSLFKIFVVPVQLNIFGKFLFFDIAYIKTYAIKLLHAHMHCHIIIQK